MSNFNIGDSVEVLPAPEEAGFTWRMVGRRQGTVNCIDTRHPLSRTVGVLFQDGSVYWCEPAWLRRVGHASVRCASCGQEVPGTQAVDHDTPSRPQEARSAPEHAKPDPQVAAGEREPGKPPRAEPAAWLDAEEVARLMGEEPPEPPRVAQGGGRSDTAGENAIWGLVDVTIEGNCLFTWFPRYQAGNLVDMGNFTGGRVLDVDKEPHYVVQWPDGHVQRIKESTLRPHEPKPEVSVIPPGRPWRYADARYDKRSVLECWKHGCMWMATMCPLGCPDCAAPDKCAPDGARCAWMEDQPAGSVHVLGWLYCPGCGGKLQNDRDDA